MNGEWMIRALGTVAGLLLALSLSAPVALAQGFAGLGQSAEGFAVPVPDRPFDFPADHGAHPDYRIEWWYLTANLTGPDGTDYGIQWTLFRSALAPEGAAQGWSRPQIWMGHAALTTADTHRVAERFARGGVGQAGVTAEPFDAWIDDWSMTSRAEMGEDAYATLDVSARGANFSYALHLDTDALPVPQGIDGYSVKSAEGQASYYYSQPFYTVSGTLTLDGEDIPVTGRAWLDREWSSQPLSEDQTGWDWFSLHLNSGEKVMAFRLRQTGGADYTSGTWIAADGTPTPLPDGVIEVTPLETAEVAGRDVPVRWRLAIPERDLDIETRALNPQAWMATAFSYWEGPIRFDGTTAGIGYLEMTGYD